MQTTPAPLDDEGPADLALAVYRPLDEHERELGRSEIPNLRQRIAEARARKAA